MSDSRSEVLDLYARDLLALINCDVAVICIDKKFGAASTNPALAGDASVAVLSFRSGQTAVGPRMLALPQFIEHVSHSSTDPVLLAELSRRSVSAFLAVPVTRGPEVCGFIECHYLKPHARWSRTDIYKLFERAESLDSYVEDQSVVNQASGDSFSVPPQTLVVLFDSNGHVLEQRAGPAHKAEVPGVGGAHPPHVLDVVQSIYGETVARRLDIYLDRMLSGARATSFVGILPYATESDAIVPFLVRLTVHRGSHRFGLLSLRMLDWDAAPDIVALQALHHQAEVLLLTVSRDWSVNVVAGSVEVILGVQAAELASDPRVWLEILPAHERNSIVSKAKRLFLLGQPFDERVSYQHLQTGIMRKARVQCYPHVSPRRRIEGWRVVITDVTTQYNLEEKLALEQVRSRALCEAARVSELFVDSGHLASRLISLMVRATRSDSGFICLRDRRAFRFQIVAADGISPQHIETLAIVVNQKSLVHEVAERGASLIVNDVVRDERAANDIVRVGGARSAALVPIMFGQAVLGVVVVTSSEVGHYATDDLDFLAALASHISLRFRSFSAQRSAPELGGWKARGERESPIVGGRRNEPEGGV